MSSSPANPSRPLACMNDYRFARVMLSGAAAHPAQAAPTTGMMSFVSEKKRKPLHPVFGVFLLLFGGVFLAVGVDQRLAGSDSVNWPVVSAEITAGKVEHETGSMGTAASAQDFYYARISYRYEHGGTNYEHTGFDIGGSRSFGSEGEAAALVAKYPVGSSVPVHVNPARPDAAVIEIGVPNSSQLLLGAGGFLMLFALIILSEWWRARGTG